MWPLRLPENDILDLPNFQTPKGGIDPRIDMKWGPYAPKRSFTEGVWSHRNLVPARLSTDLIGSGL